MAIKKWKLISQTDVSPSKWFPIENRVYELPNGKIVDDFTVTTLADVAMVIPITKDKKVVLANQYKPSVDSVMLQFPAGRIEPNHENMVATARHELEEEVGIKVAPAQLTEFAKLTGFSTKASEIVYVYLATECEFNSQQNFDPTEDIEVCTYTFTEFDELIENGTVFCAQTIAAWELAKKKFPKVL